MNSQAALFDQLAANDRLYDYHDDALTALDALVPEKGILLDIGCGDGVLTAAYRATGSFGFDVSPKCARLASRKGVKTAVADCTLGFPFPEKCFDTVYCVSVLHHLHNAWDVLFAEMDRVLRPGGTLVIVEPDARNALVKWTQAPGSPIRTAPYDNEPAIDARQLFPYLDRLGFTHTCRPINVEGDQVTPSAFPLWNRALKAPFVWALAWRCRRQPNKFAIIAKKPA